MATQGIPLRSRILLVDDRVETRASLARLLAQAGYEVQDAADIVEALARLRALPFDGVVTDVRLERHDDGLRLLRTVREELPHLPVVLYSGFARTADAVLAIKLGAADYLEFPIDPDQILLAVSNAVESRRSPRILGQEQSLAALPYGIIAASAAMCSIVYWIDRIGATDLTALITGETGTGKEVVARALHTRSERRTRPFVAVNCGAIPEGLFESEFFGHRRGAFTGAFHDKVGVLEEAHCGTLFLDEVAELPLPTQARFLRFLDGGEFRRLGETKNRCVDVRIIAATNRDLHAEVSQGQFRSDLYFRLNVAKCCIPPLRERLEDLDALFEFWFPRFARRIAPAVRAFSSEARSVMRKYHWPGNVRELRSVLEHTLGLANGDTITERDVIAALGSSTLDTAIGDLNGHELRDNLITALERHHWKIGRTAASLGISRSTLWRHLKKHGIREIRQ
jgi:DNA-binding NtrC family response regulator